MKNFNHKEGNSSLFAILVVAILVAAVGFYTDSMGFVAAGCLFLLVGIIMFLNRFRRKQD